jgi:hypothetical protein
MNQHRQSECGNLLSLSIVVQYQHHEPHAVAGLGVLPHLPIAGRIAERGVGPAAGHQVDPSGLPALSSFSNSFGSLVRTGRPFLS